MVLNVGRYRFPITLYYIASEAVSDMGSSTPTFTTYSVIADMEELSDMQRIKYGLNVDESSFLVKCRKPVSGRPIKLAYNSADYRIVSFKLPRLGDNIEIICTKLS